MNLQQIKSAADSLLAGGVVAYPTEGVWGLGCDPYNFEAVDRIARIKGRPLDKGMLLISGQVEHFAPLYQDFDAEGRLRLESGWQSFQTWVLPNRGFAPQWVTGDNPGIAVRVTKHPLVSALTQRFGGPIISTSANLAGQPAIMDFSELRSTLGEQLDYLLPGELGGQSKASTIVDFISGRVLRT